MSPSPRELWLTELIAASIPIGNAVDHLAELGWDSGVAPIVMSGADAASVLRRYLSGELSGSAVQEWAEALESREDVEYEGAVRQLLDEFIFEIANPEINRPLSPDLAAEWLRRLER